MRCGLLHTPLSREALHPVCPACIGAGPAPAYAGDCFFRLGERTIDDVVTETSPGSYALGYSDGSSFLPFYVGRADSDLNRRLHEWVGAPSHSGRAPATARESWRLPSVFPGFGPRTRSGIGAGADSSYTCFTFRYSASAADAFESECRDYHDLGGHGGLDNHSHPEPPFGTPWECPLHR